MDPAQQKDKDKFITLSDAANLLSVSVDTLLEWNEINILKPTISSEGKVGYTNEQLNKFLSVQQIFNKNTALPSSPSMYRHQIQDQTKHIGSSNDHTESIKKDDVLKSSKKEQVIAGKKSASPHLRLISYGLTSCFVTILITSLYLYPITPVYQEGVKSTSNYKVDDSTSAKLTSEVLMAQTEGDPKFKGTSIAAPEKEVSHLIALAESTNSMNLINDQDATTAPQNVEQYDNLNNAASNNEFRNSLTTFSSRPNVHTGSESIFDDDGNIIGETDNVDALTMTFGSTSLTPPHLSTERTRTSGFIIIIFSIGLIMIIYNQYKHSAYAVLNIDPYSDIPHVDPSGSMQQNILEVNQKADGTVVICFNGNEYKVSKPELNSETDRFIQRILELSNKIGTEIEYDILEDELLELNAPLSKIVTRLGFVGPKRDLFFPRTSKHKVVFRRSISQRELNKMELTNSDISQELLN